ncbi:hypothetical protein HU200_021995 [Digitaria exilis]|uniref:Uncharacterized protein n=1 Tax=Digitaria exilis TaxID=1010633 RepID=A0A835CD91_9POAL|nr:hypothetical protein HU200_021995 [Digitaria exilis]
MSLNNIRRKKDQLIINKVQELNKKQDIMRQENEEIYHKFDIVRQENPNLQKQMGHGQHRVDGSDRSPATDDNLAGPDKDIPSVRLELSQPQHAAKEQEAPLHQPWSKHFTLT